MQTITFWELLTPLDLSLSTSKCLTQPGRQPDHVTASSSAWRNRELSEAKTTLNSSLRTHKAHDMHLLGSPTLLSS